MRSTHLPDFPATRRAEHFNFDRFAFGETPTDHMCTADFRNGGWSAPVIQQFENFSLSPFSSCLHYGQTVFEGMKAFRLESGAISIFRPDKHHARFNRSLERMGMPPVPESLFLEGLTQLIRQDEDWLPVNRKDLALYIRPFVIATQPRLGVKVSDHYRFAIVCTPITQYYTKPLRVKVETHFVRAAEGSTGYAKCGGNYGGAFYPMQKATEEGFDQLIWTDARTHQYLEEAGTMNVMLVVHHTLITPPLSSAILDGVTRDSMIQLARDRGMRVEERPVSISELSTYLQDGTRIELFGVGTAAVVSPIASVQIEGTAYFPYQAPDATMFVLKQELESIRRGLQEDRHGWNYIVD